ncbi:Cyclic AMP-dependent transcription factor ATF-1 [Orchesella cincta]|uniref:Cyclic AMP-dependent transcription factor ATF-1 n=1 Tax=Orchesella cincta TaxID=48709 RepID=A0A1D2MSX3_ORCCI|nr:Cyclic AMP-dependent transcription factor ATF-1 [Orchesella cincta]
MEVIVPDVKTEPDLEASGRNIPVNSRQRASATLSFSGGGHNKIHSAIHSSSAGNHSHHHSITSSASLISSSAPQSVIQSPSVIQSASGQLQLPKGNVIFVKQNPSVIQTAGGAIQTVQVLGSPHSDESLSNDGIDHPEHGRPSDKRRREILSRRPSYRKIFSELSGAEISGDRGDSASTSESSQDADGSSGGGIVIGNAQYPPGVVKVIPANALGLGQVPSAEGSNVPAAALQTITMTNAGTAGGTIVQYAQSQDGQQFFVPVGSELQAYTIRPVSSASSSPSVVVAGSLSGGQHGHPDEANKKREIRLLKNREAARECRRKKKEYIKCLENRVAVLENQNKALIDELKSLKELYCQQKTE